jgi:mono/diheme cytochrome c family protein
VTRNDVILGIAALVLVGFSLVVALVVPRRRADFPGPRLGVFVFVCLLLVAGMLAAVEVFGGEEDREEIAKAGNAVTQVEDSGEPDTEGGETSATETSGGETQEGEAGGGGDAGRGKELFAANGCGGCHTLEAADAGGTVGPNLDDLKPSSEAVVEQVTNGGNGMPAFGDKLSPAEIEDVAAFVTKSTGG